MTIGPRRNWGEIGFLGAGAVFLAVMTVYWVVDGSRGYWWPLLIGMPVTVLCSWFSAVSARQTMRPVVLTSSQLLYPDPYSFTKWHAIDVAMIARVQKDEVPTKREDFSGWYLRIDRADGSHERIEVDKEPLFREHESVPVGRRDLTDIAEIVSLRIIALQGPDGPMARYAP